MSITAGFNLITQIPGLASLLLNLTPKKSTKLTFSANKIYYMYGPFFLRIIERLKILNM